MIDQPFRTSGRVSRWTLRLTFHASGSTLRLVSVTRLEMICPPSIGERPVAGRHGGFWAELRDAHGAVIFHRILNHPFGDSVEVHSPDAPIRSVVGTPVGDRSFDVLLPDVPEAKSVAIIGKPPGAKGAHTRELVHFDLTPYLGTPGQGTTP